ncbi:MAG: MoaD/ThiS family protein, partial [Thermodesulfobacteriota bacterium]
MKILLFGQLASAAKTNSFELTFAGKESSVAVIKNIIFDRFPKLEKQVFRMAVNQEIVGDAFSVKDSDEIALLPPMSGGNFSYLATKKITKKMINQILNTTHDSCGSVITFRGIVRADKKRKDVYVTT